MQNLYCEPKKPRDERSDKGVKRPFWEKRPFRTIIFIYSILATLLLIFILTAPKTTQIVEKEIIRTVTVTESVSTSSSSSSSIQAIEQTEGKGDTIRTGGN
jgi:cell division protein FtsX